MKRPSRPGPCCARDDLPRCIGDACSHCPDCGDHRFRFEDASCTTCHPIIEGVAAKPKPARARAGASNPDARSVEPSLLEPVAEMAPSPGCPSEADLVLGRVLGCLECGEFTDGTGSDGVRCACGAWATRLGSAIMANRLFDTPLPPGVSAPDDVVPADPSPPPVRIRSVEEFRAEFGMPLATDTEQPEGTARIESAVGEVIAEIEFDLIEPTRDAARVAENRPGITGMSSPRTSVAAAMTLPTGKRRVQVLTTLARHRVDGRTAEELEGETGLGGSTIRPRLLELEADGFVERTDMTRPTRSGMRAVVWGVTMRGTSAADRLNGRPAGMP